MWHASNGAFRLGLNINIGAHLWYGELFSVIYHFHVRDSGCFYSSILSMLQICKEGSFLLIKKKKNVKKEAFVVSF